MKNDFKSKLPMYFNVDGDILVKVFLSGDEIKAINQWGNFYPSFKAVMNGTVTTKAEFENATLNREGQPIPFRANAVS